jgi:AcrR family transcriptional regulator
VEANQRERLLDAAVACFGAGGVNATALRDIAAHAGVTPALVHYYFGSKEQLLDAFVAERLLPIVGGLKDALVASDGDARTLASGFVKALHAAVDRAPWLPRLWLHEVIADNGALRAVFFSQVVRHVPLKLAASFTALKQHGALHAGLDPRLLVVSLIGLTLFPLAAEPIWRSIFGAADVDRAMLERHTLALLERGLEGDAHAR